MGWLHNEEEWLSLHLIFTLLTTRMHLRGHICFVFFPPPRHNIHLPLLPICGRVSGWVPALHAKPHSEAVKMKWISSLAARGGCVLRDTPWQERTHKKTLEEHTFTTTIYSWPRAQSVTHSQHAVIHFPESLLLSSNGGRVHSAYESIWMSPPFWGIQPSTSEEVTESSEFTSFWLVCW